MQLIGIQQNALIGKANVSNLIPRLGGNCYATAKVAGKAIGDFLETEDFIRRAKNRLPAAIREVPSFDG